MASSCPVCFTSLKDLSGGETVVGLPCGCAFHGTCIATVASDQEKTIAEMSCPSCGLTPADVERNLAGMTTSEGVVASVRSEAPSGGGEATSAHAEVPPGVVEDASVKTDAPPGRRVDASVRSEAPPDEEGEEDTVIEMGGEVVSSQSQDNTVPFDAAAVLFQEFGLSPHRLSNPQALSANSKLPGRRRRR